MPLNESKGQMYSWVGFTHTHLGGECPHKCSYCYTGRGRFGRPPRYEGPLRLIEKEFNVNYGTDRIIFVENCNDLFAFEVPHEMILRVLEHCCKYPDNTYVFQTKNPLRYFGYLKSMPPHVMLGTTIETNRKVLVMAHSKAPEPSLRKEGMVRLTKGNLWKENLKTFVTIEPIMDLDVDVMLLWLQQINPTFVNVGADSKGTNLPEPSADKVHALLDGIGRLGIEIRQKSNLTRLLRRDLEGPVSPANPVPQPKKERVKILHEEIRFCDACIYCHEDGNRKEIVCTRIGKRLPDEWIMRDRQEPMVPMEIPDWCPLPDKKED